MKFKTFLVSALTVVMALSVTLAVTMSVDELKQLVSNDLGGFYSPDIIGPSAYTQTIKATTTLRSVDSGYTFLLDPTNGKGQTVTLPAAEKGVEVRFIVSDAFATNNWIIDSAEGDNIEGTLVVAGAVVDCAAEDQINLVADGENLGDYVELYSDGTNWYIMDSGVLTAAKMTCTDPS